MTQDIYTSIDRCDNIAQLACKEMKQRISDYKESFYWLERSGNIQPEVLYNEIVCINMTHHIKMCEILESMTNETLLN